MRVLFLLVTYFWGLSFIIQTVKKYLEQFCIFISTVIRSYPSPAPRIRRSSLLIANRLSFTRCRARERTLDSRRKKNVRIKAWYIYGGIRRLKLFLEIDNIFLSHGFPGLLTKFQQGDAKSRIPKWRCQSRLEKVACAPMEALQATAPSNVANPVSPAFSLFDSG